MSIFLKFVKLFGFLGLKIMATRRCRRLYCAWLKGKWAPTVEL